MCVVRDFSPNIFYLIRLKLSKGQKHVMDMPPEKKQQQQHQQFPFDIDVGSIMRVFCLLNG